MDAVRLICSLLAVHIIGSSLFAQTAALHGVVSDQSGAVVPGAKITLAGPPGSAQVTKSAGDGTYSFSGLAAGDYVVQASAADLALPQPVKISLKPGLQTVSARGRIATRRVKRP
jgi:hypothetical protein